jgi:sec-independent protein translocase protein TatA
MGPLGLPELILIFVVALIIFGPRRLPEIGRTIGKALGEFKKATDDFKNTIEREVHLDELRQIPPVINASMTPSLTTVSRTEPVTTVVAEAAPHVPEMPAEPKAD